MIAEEPSKQPRILRISDTYMKTYHLVMPRHANPLGVLFGGYMMDWIVEIGTLNTMRLSRRNTVLGFIDNLFFINPVRIGDVLIYRSWIVRVRRTSMEVLIEVLSRNISGEYYISSAAKAIYVALDHENKPVDTGFRVYSENDWEKDLFARFSKWREDVDKLIEKEDLLSGEPEYEPKYSLTSIRRVSPEDVMSGDIMYAGNLLQYIDEISGILASRYAGEAVVTASVDQIIFKKAIKLGDVIKLRSSLTRTWKSSMEIKTVVSRLTEDKEEKLVEAYSTFVKIGSEGKPEPLSPYLPLTPEEYKEWVRAEERRMKRMDRIEKLRIFRNKRIEDIDLEDPRPLTLEII
ncbi:MAG: hotdog domain-containing protein [Sulfolobales archaeon]